MKRFAAPLLALVAQCLCTARADVQTLVTAKKVSWTGASEIIYLNSDGSTASSDSYEELVLKFTNTVTQGSITLASGTKAIANILLVGGGGAGGSGGGSGNDRGAGGGGGAGGFLLQSAYTLDAATTYTINVGTGGVAAAAGSTTPGGNGGSSLFKSGSTTLLEAFGGGGGGAESDGNAGASGGGGSLQYSSTQHDGGACTNGQGNIGGPSGSYNRAAGGGGGSSSEGSAPVGNNKGGAGGAGTESDITGTTTAYAGGGGGGTKSASVAGNIGQGGSGGGGDGAGNSSYAPVPGTPGLGGGGGGGSLTVAGANGGSGVVIVRITYATETMVPVPTVDDVTYTGENIVGFDPGISYSFVSGKTNATDVGSYTVIVKPADDFTWTDGTTSSTGVTWKIVQRVIDLPVVVSGLSYTGEQQTGVTYPSEYDQYCEFTEASVIKATNAGTYSFTVSLISSANTVWSDGTTDAITKSWTIDAIEVMKPTKKDDSDLIYDGTAQNGFESLDWTRYELISGTTNETAGGTYEATFHLLGNDDANNYVWSNTTSVADYTIQWSIGASTNKVTSLGLVGWRVGESAGTPTITATWGANTATYSYGFGESADSVTGWITDTSVITNAGTWVLRAIIPETASWNSATGTTTFVMWDDPSQVYRDWTEITVKARSGATETLTNFPVMVRISETRMPGFSYEREGGHNGEQMAFLDSDGNLLPYEVDTWNTDGESIVWVKLATLPPSGATITNYWTVSEGQPTPTYTPEEVWSDDYVGVWHMNVTNSTKVVDTKGASDGTLVGSAAIANGTIGSAISLPSAGSYINCGSTISNSVLASGFTIEGWANSSSTDYRRYLFGRNAFITIRTGYATEICVTTPSVNDHKFSVSLPSAGEWYHYALSFAPGATDGLNFYLNGVLIHTEDASTPSDTTSASQMLLGASQFNTSGLSFLGLLDEYRLSKTVHSAEWLSAEYQSAYDTSFTTNSVVYNDGLIVNSWVDEPAMDFTTWDINDTPGQITSTGKLLYGSVTNYIYSIYDPSEVYSAISEISNPGSYRIVFTQADSTGYQPIEKTFDIRILASKPYSDIVGTGGDSGRVLLMNNHIGEDGVPDIDYQGWYDSDNVGAKSSSTSTYWHHVNTDAPAVTGYNLKNGTESVLYALGGRRLWHLVNCRHGNTFPNRLNIDLTDTQNYLPWRASYSKTISAHSTSGNQLAATKLTVGQVVMQNTEAAVVYSPCYTNGIGTIYFDAVNGWCRNSDDFNNYSIVVEYATNTVANLPPTDDNCCSYLTNYVDGVEIVSTNWYGNLNTTNWHAATMRPFVRDNTDDFVETNATTALALSIANGGTMDNFYRIVVPLDYKGPIRFRIKRSTRVPDTLNTEDDGGFILLDNIIASPPAMGAQLGTPGHYDGSRSGKQQIGWELATSVPYPAISDGEVTGYAVPEYYVNAETYDGTTVDTNAFVATAMMHYRWRYLTQTNSEWQVVELAPGNGFKAVEPIEFPDFTCDFEYWYEAKQQAPFYTLVDYTGLGKTLDYSEERGVVTNALNSASILASSGTNWFFRVRDGHSDYRSLDIVYTRDTNTLQRVPMMLVGDHIWRGFIPTPTNYVGDILYRIEGLDRQTEEFAAYSPSTNHWYCTAGGSTLPISDKIEAGTTNNWSTLTLDATTGYVMFQIDDDGFGITIVHADYQNFNYWSDARGTTFVGNSTEDTSKSGTSPSKQTFTQNFDSWSAMPTTDAKWQFTDFQDIAHLRGRDAYESFSEDTDGLWATGPGMWISKKYRLATTGAGVALQMEGCGSGYLQLNDTSFAPRGIETVTFNARLGQFIGFDDFNYYMGAIPFSMTNYTFMTRCAFDLNSNKNFEGNASLSLVADHLPNKGCYEARWEWVQDMTSSKGGQRLCLYRWNVTSGKKSETLLAAWTNVNTFAQVTPTVLKDSTSHKFMPFYITVSNDTVNACTWVAAGVLKDGVTLSSSMSSNVDGWYIVACRDSSKSRLTRGSYGVLSANCEGVFGNPQYSATAVLKEELNNLTAAKPAGYFTANGSSAISRSFPGLEQRSEGFDTGDTFWNIQPGRMASLYTNDVSAIVADPASQDLEIYLTSAGSSDWGSVVTNISLSSFGGNSFSLPLYATDKSAIKFKSGAEFDDPRTDIVIDSVVVTQFRGDDYSNDEEMVNYIPDWQDPYSVSPGFGLTNWVFTSAWIQSVTSGSTTDGRLLLSARRTRTSDVSAIRSPLMDGYEYASGAKRGSGLGMISFDYVDAQSNAVLLVQIATNGVYSSTLQNFDTNDDSLWETVETIDFSTFTEQERASGTLSTYIGLHGINGLVRIVVDPALVTKLASETNTTAFGEVKICKIVCRDEPELDSSCWWGWNLRTIGATLREDTEKKMYLPDLATDSEDVGMSLALNHSVTEDTIASEYAVYKQHVPFVQTPTFTSDIVGEISFKARKYDTTNAQPASVTLYGSKTGSVDSDWTTVTNFVVSGDLYQTYSYRTDPGTTYAAFRLGVSGVAGVEKAGSVVPSDYSTPVRVLIEEVFVSEAVRTRMAFKNVGAFRSDLSTTVRIANVPSKSEQPLCNEGWGVQCEVYPAQLGSEIDTSRDPVVYLHWFEGTSPWGFENWKGLSSSAGHHSAKLAQATDTNMVFRSSYVTAPDAIIGMSTKPGTVVQYMLEVRYYQLGSDVVCTNYLTASDWTRPSWYTPIDYNADFGGNAEDAFSAYNILDTVAPGWAWINEVNIHGKYDANGANTEANAQFVEIAVPVEADISGWYVRFLDGTGSSTGTIVTNVVAEFGTSELPGMKTGNIGAESNMVFRVIACPKALTSGTLKTSDGTLDDTWSFDTTTSTFLKDGRIFETEPFGIQLVRASGVVEHEIVCIGTNFWGSVAGYEQYYSPTNTVEFFKKCMRESAMFYAGADEANVNASNEFRSLGVFESSGETSNQWNNVMKRTPGRINEGQSIDPDHPTPNGETIVVFCNVDTSFGHVYQTVGEAVETDASQTIFMRRGSGRGTNIVYKVDPWYQLDTVTTNGTAVSYTASGDNTYVATVGVGASNSFTVVATAKVNDDLENIYGITDDNRYRPAVMDWLSKRVDLKGNAWADQTAYDIKLADFINASDVVLTNLNLTQMYWLDMDPTVGDLALKGYVSKAPSAHYVTGSGGQSLTNLRFDVFMQITNRASAKAWTPYALRGLAPGSSSLDYTNSTFKTSWTSETFKAVGFINNGHTGVRVRDNWVPLRWFVFVPSSFRQPGETDAFTSTIEVVDPFSPESPAYEAGWYEEAQNNGKPQDYYFWCLDERIQPISVEILQKESIYDD